jgi:hypothetical protein
MAAIVRPRSMLRSVHVVSATSVCRNSASTSERPNEKFEMTSQYLTELCFGWQWYQQLWCVLNMLMPVRKVILRDLGRSGVADCNA